MPQHMPKHIISISAQGEPSLLWDSPAFQYAIDKLRAEGSATLVLLREPDTTDIGLVLHELAYRTGLIIEVRLQVGKLVELVGRPVHSA